MKRLFVLLALVAGSARALDPIGLLLPFMALGEVHVGNTNFISNQGNYPYCSLYSVANFLEISANSAHPRRRYLKSIEPGYLALAFNLEHAPSLSGTSVEWLLYSVWKHGVVSREAWNLSQFPEGTEYLKNGWMEAHRSLIDAKNLRLVLNSQFHDPDFRVPVTGRDYFQKSVGISLSRLQMYYSTHKEKYIESRTPEVDTTPYRFNDEKTRKEHKKKVFEDAGFAVNSPDLEEGKLYEQTKGQLEKGRPVLITLNPSLVNGLFSNYDLVTNGDLYEVNHGYYSSHSLLAVGVCDSKKSRLPICKDFADQFKERKIEECLLLQNSWGPLAHDKGFACLSRNAALRMVVAASDLK